MEDISMCGRYAHHLHFYQGSCQGEGGPRTSRVLSWHKSLTLMPSPWPSSVFWYKNKSVVVSVMGRGPSAPTCSHGDTRLFLALRRVSPGWCCQSGPTHRLKGHQKLFFFNLTFFLLFSPLRTLLLPYHCPAGRS